MTSAEKFLQEREKRRQEQNKAKSDYTDNAARFLAEREERRKKQQSAVSQTSKSYTENESSTAKQKSYQAKTQEITAEDIIHSPEFTSYKFEKRTAENKARETNNKIMELAEQAASMGREGNNYLDEYINSRMNFVGPVQDPTSGLNDLYTAESARNKYKELEEQRIRNLDTQKLDEEINRLKEQQKSSGISADGTYADRDITNRINSLEADKTDYNNYKSTDEFLAKYNSDPAFKAEVDEYNANRDYWQIAPWYNKVGMYLDNALQSGVTQAAKLVNDLFKMGYDFLSPLIVGENYSNPVAQYFEAAEKSYEAAEKRNDMMKYAYDNDILSKTSDALASTIASLPMYAAAVATGGTSAAGQMLTASTYNAATAKTADMLTKSLTALAKDPNYWASFLSMYAPSVENAKAQGANDVQAALVGFFNSFAGSVVEIGGGIQKIPTSKKGVVSWLKNLADEGKEEVIQGAIEQLTNKAIHNYDAPYFSLDDENAVINPGRALNEFAGGAFGAALIGGGHALYNSAANGSLGNVLSKAGKTIANNSGAAFSKNKTDVQQDNGKPIPYLALENPTATVTDESGYEYDTAVKDVVNQDGKLMLVTEDGETLPLDENITPYDEASAIGLITKAQEALSETETAAEETTEQLPRRHIQLADENAAELVRLAERYDLTEDASKALINNAPKNAQISNEDYAHYFNQIYSLAAKGVSPQQIISETGGYQAVMGIEPVIAAANAGARQYDLQQAQYDKTLAEQRLNQQYNAEGAVIDETGDTAPLAVKKVTESLAKKTGYNIRLIDGSKLDTNKNGSFNSSKGEIVIDISKGNPIATAIHETSHYIELNSPEDFKSLAGEIRDTLVSNNVTVNGKTTSLLQFACENYARTYSEKYGSMTAQQVMAEITSDSAEALLYNDNFLKSLLTDETVMNELTKAPKSKFRQFMEKLKEVIAAIKEYIKGKGRNSTISEVFSEDVKALERIEKLYLQGLENAKKNYDNAAKTETEGNKKTAEDSGSKYSITIDMTEDERYEELKDKKINIAIADEKKLENFNIESLKELRTNEAKKPIREIAEALGIHGVNYHNSSIAFDFKFSKGSLDVSVNHQKDFSGDYSDYAKMLSCLDSIITKAELIEIHTNYKGNRNLKQTYVLISSFKDGNAIYPVHLEVKEHFDSDNGLYLNVVLGQIKKEPVVLRGADDAKAFKDVPLVTDSVISLPQLFSNVNPADNKFLKYVPDKFLSEEQISAKRIAQKNDYIKYGRYKEIFESSENNKFSLSDPIEYTKDLVADNNLHEGNKKTAEDSGEKYSVAEQTRTYSYEELTEKPDMKVNVVSKINLPMSNGKIIRADVISMALNNVAKIGNSQNKNGKIFLYNNDLGRNVKITTDSIKHGLSRKSENNAIASLALPYFFSDSICVNELAQRGNNKKSYVLLGMFEYNANVYFVRTIVSERNNVCEIEDVNVLYAINAKKKTSCE